MLRTPPHILITTPESLLSDADGKIGAATSCRTARWIIIDELHALIDTKRGVTCCSQ
jgi:ATP-dependent Lhr-like helicase